MRFASAADRAAFVQELTAAVAGLVSRYHDEQAEGGRDHRVIVAIHPSLRPDATHRVDAAAVDADIDVQIQHQHRPETKES